MENKCCDRSKSTFKLAGGKVGWKRERVQVYVCMHGRKGGQEGGERAEKREREKTLLN
jgi:hypothetical protein